MKTAEEGRTLTEEIVELLQRASKEDKLIIKGILLKAKETPTLNDMRKEHGLGSLADGDVVFTKV